MSWARLRSTALAQDSIRRHVCSRGAEACTRARGVRRLSHAWGGSVRRGGLHEDERQCVVLCAATWPFCSSPQQPARCPSCPGLGRRLVARASQRLAVCPSCSRGYRAGSSCWRVFAAAAAAATAAAASRSWPGGGRWCRQDGRSRRMSPRRRRRSVFVLRRGGRWVVIDLVVGRLRAQRPWIVLCLLRRIARRLGRHC